MNSYADLRIAFDDDYEALCKHYITYGIYENRTMALKPVMTPAVSQDSSVFDGIVYYYDANGNIASAYIYDMETGELLIFVTFEYNANGDMTRADRHLADGTYVGYLEYSYGTDGSYTEKDFDSNGNLMFTNVYDALDRRIKWINQDGYNVEYTYSSNNTLVSEEYKDADGNRIHFVEYNENRQKIKFTYGNGHYYTYEYTADTIIEKYYYDDGTLSRTTVYDYDWNIISNT